MSERRDSSHIKVDMVFLHPETTVPSSVHSYQQPSNLLYTDDTQIEKTRFKELRRKKKDETNEEQIET